MIDTDTEKFIILKSTSLGQPNYLFKIGTQFFTIKQALIIVYNKVVEKSVFNKNKTVVQLHNSNSEFSKHFIKLT